MAAEIGGSIRVQSGLQLCPQHIFDLHKSHTFWSYQPSYITNTTAGWVAAIIQRPISRQLCKIICVIWTYFAVKTNFLSAYFNMIIDKT